MSITLCSTEVDPHGPYPWHSAVSMNLPTWARLLHLARSVGWRPRGQLPSLDHVRSLKAMVAKSGELLGDFDAGRAFTREEARAFGAALENALLDTAPDESGREKIEMAGGLPFPARPVPHPEWFSGPGRRASSRADACRCRFG